MPAICHSRWQMHSRDQSRKKCLLPKPTCLSIHEHAHLSMPLHECMQSVNTHIYPCRSMHARKAWTRTFIHAAPCMHAKREHAHLSMPLHACTQSMSTRIYPCCSMHARKAWTRTFIHAAPCMHAKHEHAHLSMPLHACTQRCICMCVYMHIRKSGSTSFIWIMLKLSMVHHDLKILIFKMKQMK